MFISKYGKSYDDADGSEQQIDGPGRNVGAGSQRGGQIGRERWEDDGGPANDLPAHERQLRPAWSVLSLHDLNEQIRRGLQADNPARQRRKVERRAAQERQQADDDRAAAARAAGDRYRNAWENT